MKCGKAASLIWIAGLSWSAVAWGQVDMGRNPVEPEWLSAAELGNELRSERRSDRLYAARELRRQVRRAARRTGRGNAAVAQEARVELFDLRQDIGDSARAAVVAHDNVRPILADLLRLLDDPASVPALTEALQADPRRRVDRKIARAIEALEAP